MFAEFHFLRPEWFWLLPVVVALVLLLARRQLAPGNWQRVVSPALAPYVLSMGQSSKLAYRWWLLALGAVLAIVALAGPAWERIEQPVFRSEQAMVIALDMSRSMDAQDVAPSRLIRARLKILDLLEERQSGQTALVVFSANAFVVTPLTSDTETIAALVNSLTTDIMPSRGSYPAAGIRKSVQLLEQASAGYGEVLLITDSSSTPEAELAANELRDSGYVLSVMGVGTREGAPIPRAGGGFVTDRSGNIAVPKLDPRSLRELANEGGGIYVQLSSTNSDIDALMSGEVDVGSSDGPDMATDQWKEQGQWLLLILLPLAALAFRRGLVICLAFFLVPMSEPAHALGWEDLWFNADQQGQKKFQEGEPADAAALFDDPKWQAASRYESGEFIDSAALFAEFDDASSLYNLGNAMAKQGEFEAALDAYEQSLEIEPDNEDAVYNRDLIAELKRQKDQQEGEQQEGQESDSESGGDSEQSDSENDSDQQNQEGASGESDSESQQSDSMRDQSEMNEEEMRAMQEELDRARAEAEEQQGEESEQPAMSEAEAEARRLAQEQTQAMEQWLRRVENDPGGLLRNKFRYQYQRKGVDQDGNSVWPDDNVEPW